MTRMIRGEDAGRWALGSVGVLVMVGWTVVHNPEPIAVIGGGVIVLLQLAATV